jgi:hypothetical protein
VYSAGTTNIHTRGSRVQFPHCAATVMSRKIENESGLRVCTYPEQVPKTKVSLSLFSARCRAFFMKNNFHKTHQKQIVLWFILIIVTVISGYLAFIWTPPKNTEVNITQTSTSTETTEIIAPTTQTTKSPKKTNQIKVKEEINKTNASPETITTTLIIENTKYEENIPPNNSVYTLIKKIADEGKIKIIFKDFGSDLGYLVQSINGIANNQKENKNWIYYINGKKAQIGISNYHLNPGDTITWKYEADENI